MSAPSTTAAPPVGAPAPVTAPPTMADPTPIGFGLLGFALAAYGVRFAVVNETTVAAGSTTVGLNYAILISAIAVTLAGILAVIRGMAYPAYVSAVLGIWLIGFYEVITAGAANKLFTPNALAAFVLLLMIPVAILAIPAFMHRIVPFMIAFGGLLLLLLLLGLGYHNAHHAITTAVAAKQAPDLSTSATLLKSSAYVAFVCAGAIWWVFAKEVFRSMGIGRSEA